MKTILKASFVLALSFGLASCNMDLRPYSVIDPDNALESYSDAVKLANGFNNQIRSLAVGDEIYAPELQSDIFHASTDFGNRGGDLYQWNFSSNFGNAESLWASCYTAIANANYFIQKVAYVENRVENDEAFAENWTEKQLELLQGHRAEALFLRAYAHYILADRFCDSYTNANVTAEDSGIPVVTHYAPTSDKDKYPSRATLEATFGQIFSDLKEAEASIGVLREPAAGSNYITVDAVKAFRARVALAAGDYATAIQDATSVINSGTYSLVSSEADLRSLWVNDRSASEVILQSYVALSTETPGTNNYGYIGYNYSNDIYAPDYIPEQWVIDLYDDADYRKAVYFEEHELTLSAGTSDPVSIFTKFYGNPALQSGPSDYNYRNAPKPFRLAELYLIAAEAYAYSSLDNQGSSLINDLRAHRIADWENTSYTGERLKNEIKTERLRELMGEGFRLSDLKRYKQGMSRSAAQNQSTILFPGSNSTEFLSRSAGDYRFVWPIPTSETDANPKIKQNPGYVNQ